MFRTLFFCFVWNPQASAPITSGTNTDGGAVMRKPGSACRKNQHLTLIFFHFFWFGIHTASVPSTVGTSTGGGAVLGKPEGSPAR